MKRQTTEHQQNDKSTEAQNTDTITNPAPLTTEETNAKIEIGYRYEDVFRQRHLIQLRGTCRRCVQYHVRGSFLDTPVDTMNRERLQEP